MLEILRRIIQEFSDSNDPINSMRIMVKEVRAGIKSDACAVYFFDSINSKYILLASEGFKSGVDCKLTINRGDGLVGWLGERAEPINLDDAPSSPHYKYFPETGEEIYYAFLGVPIIHRKELLGVIVVQQKDKRKFNENEETFVLTVATQIGSVIAYAKLTGMINNLTSIIRSQVTNNIIYGIPGSYGMAIGGAVLTYMPADIDTIPRRKIKDIAKEIQLFDEALLSAKNEIKQLGDNLLSKLPPEEYMLFEVYISILDDSSLRDDIIEEIRTGQWAQGSVKKVIKKHISYFYQVSDEYIRERATDIKYLGQKILYNLQKKNNAEVKFLDNTILVGMEITAAAVAEIPYGKLSGLVSIEGTPNSHVAILARALNIPTIMGANNLDLDNIDGKEIILDGYNGRIYVEPDGSLREELLKKIAQDKKLYAGLESLRNAKAQTPDGHVISLLVNTGIVSDYLTLDAHLGADGVGLYRTEIPFMIRDRFPSEQEQRLLYRTMLENFHPLPVTMRTLDIGGDKTLSYFSFKEDNPFLGWRGMRITLDHPEIFLMQIRAMLSASCTLNNLSIVLPMITNLNELLEAKELIKQAFDEIVDEGLEIVMPKIGVLIEVPSVVYQISNFLPHVDFISVGTNDLVQYLLAVDRNNAMVADLYDHFNPAVLIALEQIAKAANKGNIPVSVCGEMAADPMAVILLLAMGYNSLSMNSISLVKTKWVIRNFNLARSKEILYEVMQMVDAKQIRQFLRIIIEQAGLGGLIHAGN